MPGGGDDAEGAVIAIAGSPEARRRPSWFVAISALTATSRNITLKNIRKQPIRPMLPMCTRLHLHFHAKATRNARPC